VYIHHIEIQYGHPLTTCDIGQEIPSPKASRLQLDMVELLAGFGDPNKLGESAEKRKEGNGMISKD